MKKKILFSIFSLSFLGGTEKQVFQILSNLNSNKCELHLVVCQKNSRVKKLKNNGIKIHILKNLKLYNYSLYLEYFKIIKKIKPNLVFTYFYKMEILTLVAKLLRITNFKWILNERTSPKEADSFIKHIANYFNYSQTIISNSLIGKNYWSKYFKKSVIIENGYNFKIKNKTKQKKKLKLIFLSRTTSSKNSHLFINLSKYLNLNYSLTFVSSYFENKNYEKNIILKKYQKNVDILYKNQDILFFPSEFEGSPNIVFECFLRKILVMCYRKDFSKDFFRRNLCLEIKGKDPEYIANQIKIIEKKYFADEYKNKLHHAYLYAKKFSIKKQIKKYNNFLEKN